MCGLAERYLRHITINFVHRVVMGDACVRSGPPCFAAHPPARSLARGHTPHTVCCRSLLWAVTALDDGSFLSSPVHHSIYISLQRRLVHPSSISLHSVLDFVTFPSPARYNQSRVQVVAKLKSSTCECACIWRGCMRRASE